jgi:ATP/ADP translocase
VLADVAQLTGIATIVLMATSKAVFSAGGWTLAAIITPASVLLSGIVFFDGTIALTHGRAVVVEMFGPQVGPIAGVSQAKAFSLLGSSG